jgi:uncharacterized RDD family membrane protein YckC
MDSELSGPRRYVRVPMDRRIAAFAVDFGAVSCVSLLGGSGFALLFLILWLGMRVIGVSMNRGQSLGRWAFDIKLVDPKYRAIPGLKELFQREAMTGLGSVFILMGLVNFSPANAWVLITPVPLLVDCGFAFADPDYRQAYHDQIARTMMVQTKRGYSLDIKLKKLFAQGRSRMK